MFDNKGMVGCGQEKENASSQEREMPICGLIFGKNHIAVPQETERWKLSVSRHTAQRRNRRRSRTLKSLSLKTTRRLMTWQEHGAMLDEGFMAEAGAETMQQEREEVYAALQYATSFSLLGVRNGKIVKNSSRSQKKSGSSWTRKKRRRNIERNGARKPTSIAA